jgi:hypothetical protein
MSSVSVMMAQGEPEYVDQVPRRQAYEAAHPETEIAYCGAYWQPVIREGRGETVVVRYELETLLNELQALDRELRTARCSGSLSCKSCQGGTLKG